MEANIVYTHLTSAAIFAYLLSYIQQWGKIPWVTRDTKRLNAALRLAMAGIATLGIHLTWAGSASAGWSGTWSVPPILVMTHTAFAWFGQYAVQHGWEKVFNIGGRIDPKVLNDLAEAVAQKLLQPKA